MTRRLTTSPDDLNVAAHILRSGGLVAFGTETVYGLGGDATQPEVVSRIFSAKNRPRFNPLISHFPTAEAAFAQVIASPLAHLLARTFWPGPLTLVLPRAPGSTVSDLAANGLNTLAVRVPRGPHVLSLLTLTDRPVAAPSANRSGRISPSAADHVFEELNGRIDAILDTGPCTVGLESTVLDLTHPDRPVLLRHGGISAEALEKLCGPLSFPHSETELNPLSPGRMLSHYAPSLPVRLNATEVNQTEALLAFGPNPPRGAAVTWNLSETGNLEEAASRLFEGLRYLDQQGAQHGLATLAAQPVPAYGIGLAIQDRLRRAAAPRPGHS